MMHRYKRKTLLFGDSGTVNTLIATSTGVGGGYASQAFNILLTQIPQYSEFTALYDYFKINYVVLKITWLATNVNMVDVSDSSMGAPIMYYYCDRDDVSAFSADAAGLNEMRAVSATKRFAFGPTKRTCTFKFKPSTLSLTYKTALVDSYSIAFNRWIDCAEASTPYYGAKMMFHTPTASGNPSRANYFEVEATYYMSFKQPR